jgi:hypothetical protein
VACGSVFERVCMTAVCWVCVHTHAVHISRVIYQCMLSSHGARRSSLAVVCAGECAAR